MQNYYYICFIIITIWYWTGYKSKEWNKFSLFLSYPCQCFVWQDADDKVKGREESASLSLLSPSSAEPRWCTLICSFVMTGRRLVNFNFWFPKLSNTAQMRNQFSQLPRLCGEKDPSTIGGRPVTWQTWGLVQEARVATASITGCLLSFTSITSHLETQLIFNSWRPPHK